jgi:hypothetical protein
MFRPFSLVAWAALVVMLSSPAHCFAQQFQQPPRPDISTRELMLDQQANENPVVEDVPASEQSYVFPFDPNRVWELLSERPSRAGAFGLQTGFAFGQAAVPSASYRATWLPAANVIGQPTDLSAVRQEFRWTCPVWQDERQMLGLTTGVRNVLTNTGAVLPATGQPFPEDLWDVRFGFTYRYTFSNGWVTGGNFDFGSASDRPFNSFNVLTAGVSAFLRIPVGEHNAWLFSLAYSPTAELNFPIPGVAFYWQPSDSFNATIGIPFKVVWRPVEDVILEATYMPLTTVKAKAAWRVWGGVSLYVAYDIGNESYFLVDRPDSQDRFFYYDQRVTGGVKCQFGPHCALDLSSGYAFDRFYFEGVSISDSNSNRIDVADSPFLSLMLEMRF